jgi:hypothetical protein
VASLTSCPMAPGRLAILLALTLWLTPSGCDQEKDPTGPRGPCWMLVDTLLATGIAVSDTIGAHAVFDRFIACADTAGCASQWVDVRPMQYIRSEFYWAWRGRNYWKVRNLQLEPEMGGWIPREYFYVDENGVVVYPLGCI